MENNNNYEILSNIPIAYAVLHNNISTSKYEIVFMNKKFEVLFNEVINDSENSQSIKNYLTSYIDSCEEIRNVLENVHKTSKNQDLYHYFKNIQLFVNLIICQYSDGNILMFANNENEKFKQDLLEYEIKNQHILLRTALNAVPDMIAVKDLKGKYLIVNDAVNAFYKEKFDSIEGKYVEDIYPPKEAVKVKNLDNLAVKNQKSFRKKVKVFTDKDYVITDLSRAPIYNGCQELIGIISVGKDITHQEKTRKKLLKTQKELTLLADRYKKLAYFDDLTNIYNRRRFFKDFEDMDLSTTNILILTDLNNFKLINDNFGHSFGDQVLREIAKYLKELFTDYNGEVYRLGGDEFGIIYRHHNFNILENNLDDLNRFLEKFHNELSISYGKALIYDESVKDKVNMELIINRVDKLLYEYKNRDKLNV